MSQEELFEKILLRCPKCETQKGIKVPSKMVSQSGTIITIGIPVGLICEHSFQAFVDDQSKVRGYQAVDFVIPKTEYFQSDMREDDPEEIDNQHSFTKSPIFQDIINLLRNYVDDREILGSAVFTTKGDVLYSSIPHKTLVDTIREFEVRSDEKLLSIT